MLEFTKMHGLGNDFIVIDNTAADVQLDADRIRRLSDRHFGIGCDQTLVVEAASVPEADFDYRIFNADGGEVEHCGNGARCFARFLHERGMIDRNEIRVNTSAGLITLLRRSDEQVTVKMGVPDFRPANVPFESERESTSYDIEVAGQTLQMGVVAIGNPHAVIQVPDVETAPVDTLGPLVESHARFPRRVNAGFMEIINSSHVKLRVFERGVGETRACGSGACAAVAVGRKQKLLDEKVIVTLPGGDLEIVWAGDQHNVEMTGPCTTVFEGQTRM